MKRAGLAAMMVLSVGLAAGCERNAGTSSYDPKLDGVNPPPAQPVDLSILDNQRELAARTGGASTGGTVTPSAPAASTAPATNASVESPTTAPAAPTGDQVSPAMPPN